MRQRKATATAGKFDSRLPASAELAVLCVFALAIAWVLYALVQEASLAQQLDRQTARMRQDNAGLEAENDGYRRDIAAMASGATAEEDTRRNGYSKPNETVYVLPIVAIARRAAPEPKRAAPSAALKSDWLVGLRHWLADRKR